MPVQISAYLVFLSEQNQVIVTLKVAADTTCSVYLICISLLKVHLVTDKRQITYEMATATTSLAVALVVAIAYYFNSGPEVDENLRGTKVVNISYDYIIAGAGSAGCVLANRLSEDLKSTVLILEAGGSETDNPSVGVPLFPVRLRHTDQDWAFYTEPQKNALKALNEQRNIWPRGRVLGGSSSLNYMVYMRCSRHDYDDWEAQGCKGWSFKDVLPYFMKSEDIQIPEFQSSMYRHQGGPLTVSDASFTPLKPVYQKGIEEMGYKTIDCNGEDQIGYCSMQSTIRNGERWSTAKAFLRPAMGRPNLHVSVDSHVAKVIIKDKKAVGVEFVKNGRKHTVYANKEVILSAGAVNSPQILLLSGIGPKKHLESLKIPVHADLPVGKGLQDHLFVPLKFFANQSYAITRDAVESQTNWLKYNLFRKGNLRVTGMEGSAFFKTDLVPDKKYPDIQFHFFSNDHDDPKQIIAAYNYKPEVAAQLFDETKFKDKSIYYIWVVLLHAKSEGTITLKSADPFDPPVIDPHYFEHPLDMKVMIKGMKLAIELANTNALRSIGTTPEDPYNNLPMCKEHKFNTDAYWECIIRYLGTTIYHPTTTCRMGPDNDPTVVVDNQLRVKGIANLRVADASVMRDVPSGNTNAPSIMIGEKAADMIRGIDSVKDIRSKIYL